MITRKEIYALIFFVGLILAGADGGSILAFILWHIGAISIMLFSGYMYLLEIEKTLYNFYHNFK